MIRLCVEAQGERALCEMNLEAVALDRLHTLDEAPLEESAQLRQESKKLQQLQWSVPTEASLLMPIASSTNASIFTAVCFAASDSSETTSERARSSILRSR